jgi:septum site-determining protein MinC
MAKSNSKENQAFELKGNLFTLTVLHLFKSEIELITKQLADLVKQTPKFFHHMPIVIDLQKHQSQHEIDFAALTQCLRNYQLIPIGIRSAEKELHEKILAAGFAILPNTKAETATEAAQPTPAPQKSTTDHFKVITQPVRSGQQIYARQADLIVLAPVSPGAELLADGNIHVYNALRGRALAGVNGNANTRIFCQHLEAELVAIAGHYWVSEDLQNITVKQNAHIYLDNDKLHINAY